MGGTLIWKRFIWGAPVGWCYIEFPMQMHVHRAQSELTQQLESKEFQLRIISAQTFCSTRLYRVD